MTAFRIIVLIIFAFNTFIACGQNEQDLPHPSDTTTIKTFGKNGKISKEDNFVHGKLISTKHWYYKKDIYGYWIDDKRKVKPKIVLRKDFFPDGKLKVEGYTINGKREGKILAYYQNGQSQCDCNFKKGKEDGKITYYHENGQLWSEEVYSEGKLLEVLSKFDKNGEPIEKGTLKNGNGTLFNYDENGTLTDIQHYEKGRLKKTEKKNSL